MIQPTININGTSRDEHIELANVPVAARWNAGLGRMAYYYSTDLDKALVNAGEDL